MTSLLDLDKDELERTKLIYEIELIALDQDKRSAEAENFRRNLDIALAQGQEHGRFMLYDEVSPDSVFHLIGQLDNWSNRFPDEPITITLHSPGGNVVDGLHLYDFVQTLKQRGHHVTTRAYGMAASMGAVLLQAGDVRIMAPNTFLMLHEVSSGTRGKVSSQEEQIAFSKRLQAKCLVILAERSIFSPKQVETRWKKTDWWLDADEALKSGFIDEVGV